MIVVPTGFVCWGEKIPFSPVEKVENVSIGAHVRNEVIEGRVVVIVL